MPIYEYQCPQCAHVFEEWVQVSAANDESPCPQCGTSAVHIISNTAFVLKGSGWYVTEYGSRKHEAEGAAAPAAPADSAPASADKKDSPAKDAASAAPAPAASATPAPAPAACPAASAQTA